MNRRTILVGAGVSITSVLGGCLSSSDDEGDSSPDSDSQGSSANTEALNEAYDHLETAGNEFATQADVTFETDPENPLSTSGLETAIGNAESALEDINEDEASDEQLDRLENAEHALSLFEDLLSVLVELEAGFNAVATADSYSTNDRFSDAGDQLEIAAEHFREGESLLSDAKTSWDNLDASQFEANDVELATGSDDLEHLGDVCDAFSRFCTATVDLYSGVEYYVEGANLIEQERYGAAASAFEDASNTLTDANSQYQDAETAVPQSFRKDFIDFTCLTDAFIESSDLFKEASEAMERGDWQTADTKATEAEEALNASCGGENIV
ncbi:hypothetical protein [Natrinema salaciae]|uniref:Uncharacterized protein n=1 Tax=Natrinema salaciae TaxID=1186196 RepID=A0A1H9CS62_9EURY|nr:hypothetical protein [Natrinema salaciae]SEQ03907.1 hypothetical protein SAMN04489841_1138 [Natrinema salaciae]